MAIQGLYESLFSLYSYEITGRDAIGGVIRTLVLRNANVPCYFTPIQGKELYKDGSNSVEANFRLFCDPIEISTTNIIVISNEFGTNYFNVLYVDDCNDMPVSHHFEIDLLSITAPQELAP